LRTSSFVQQLLNDADLDRHGSVENVHINDGGQAIVGNVIPRQADDREGVVAPAPPVARARRLMKFRRLI